MYQNHWMSLMVDGGLPVTLGLSSRLRYPSVFLRQLPSAYLLDAPTLGLLISDRLFCPLLSMSDGLCHGSALCICMSISSPSLPFSFDFFALHLFHMVRHLGTYPSVYRSFAWRWWYTPVRFESDMNQDREAPSVSIRHLIWVMISLGPIYHYLCKGLDVQFRDRGYHLST